MWTKNDVKKQKVKCPGVNSQREVESYSRHNSQQDKTITSGSKIESTPLYKNEPFK
jgi:hypothetical protein